VQQLARSSAPPARLHRAARGKRPRTALGPLGRPPAADPAPAPRPPHPPQVVSVGADPKTPLPINGGVFEVDTDMFKGRIEIHLRGLKTTRSSMFAGKKRFFQVGVQVRGGAWC
jgi:hypothetical protein